MNELLIANGTVVTAEEEFAADVHIRGEKIHAIYRRGAAVPSHPKPDLSGVRVIDADGCLVIPGGVDPHTHMELPLKTTQSSDTFATGSLAALHGGTTTIIDFANQVRGESLQAALDRWHGKADGKTACDYAFHVSVTDPTDATLAEIPGCVSQGVSSFKTFMAYSGMMLDDRQMLRVMERVRDSGGILLVHAENGHLVEHLISKNCAAGNVAPRFHPLSRPAIAEAEAAGRVVDLAAVARCPLYLVHMSSAAGLDRARFAAARAQVASPVYVETCIQYLLLDEKLYDGADGAQYVLSPPLRGKKDRDALWLGIVENVVSVVATDHCPFNRAQRSAPDFSLIPNGIAGVENRVELLYSEGVAKGRMSASQWVDLVATAPAKIFGCVGKGALEEGADADIVIFDPRAEHMISAGSHHMATDFSVYEGWKVTGKCRTVLLRGTVAIDGGQALVAPGFGKYLARRC